MIALISFENKMIIEREEAEALKVSYEEVDKVGIRGAKLERMDERSYYKDELTENTEGNYKDSDGKEVSSWNIYTRPKEYKDWVEVKADNHLVDLEEFALKCKYRFYISKSVKSEEPSIQNITSLLNRLEEKTLQVDNMVEMIQQHTFNQKTDVHIGGGLLATYNDLKLKEDTCTDELQNELNDGWRIIAVCVQPNQRRPDYVLGRYNPELLVYHSTEAKR